MIELNQSWAGPYHRMPLARWMLCRPLTGFADVQVEPVRPASGDLGRTKEVVCQHQNKLNDLAARVAALEAKYETLATATLDPSDVEETTDPYPADVLAACPQAREWGCQLVQKERGFGWETATHYWAYKSWEKRRPNTDQYAEWKSRKEALEKAPTIPPPGYVAAKPEAKPSLLDELAEVAMREGPYGQHVWSGVHPDTQRIWKAIALSVARRLLEREATDAEVNAFVKEYQLFDGSAFESQRAGLKASRRAQLAELEGEVPT